MEGCLLSQTRINNLINGVERGEYPSKSALENYYLNDNKSLTQCVEYFNVNRHVVQDLLKYYNIVKPQSMWIDCQKQSVSDKKEIITKEQLIDEFQSLGSWKLVGEKLNIPKCSLYKLRKEYNLLRIKLEDREDFPSLEEFVDYYITQNHTKKQTFRHFPQFKYLTQMEWFIENHNLVNIKTQEQLILSHEKAIKELYGVKNIKTLNIPEDKRELWENDELFINTVKSMGKHNRKWFIDHLGGSMTSIPAKFKKLNLLDYLDDYISSFEFDVKAYISEQLGVSIKKSTKKELIDKEIDLVSETHSIGIECDGTYWHSTAKKEKMYHQDKSLACEKINYRLIHIYEYEWNDDTKRPIIESLLKIAFGKVDKKIYARNCEIRKISNQEAKPFNEKNHLQGHRNAQVTYGLFFNDELVQLMSFSKTKYNRNLKSDNSWEIIRGCPGSNNIVIGGVSKLFKHFIKDYNPDTVFSYCDFNKFDGKGYEALGMKFIGYTAPDVKYVINGQVFNRNPKKYKENIKKAEFIIYGAGSKKYLWTKKED